MSDWPLLEPVELPYWLLLEFPAEFALLEDELEDVVPIWYVAFENALYVGFDAWGNVSVCLPYSAAVMNFLNTSAALTSVGMVSWLDGSPNQTATDSCGVMPAERDVMVLAGSTRLRRHFLAVIELGQRAVPSEVFTTPFMTSVAAWATSAEMTCVPDGWLLSTIRLLFLS